MVPARKPDPAHGGLQGLEEDVPLPQLRPRHLVHEGGLARVRVAHEADEGHALAALAVEHSHLLLLVKHALESLLCDSQEHPLSFKRLLFVVILRDHTARVLHLGEWTDLLMQSPQGLAQLGPGAHSQPSLHVLQLRKADLYLGHRRLRPKAEDLQDEPVPVKHVDGWRQLALVHAFLIAPLLGLCSDHSVGKDVLQVPGLRRRECRVDEDEAAGVLGDIHRQLCDFALAKERVWFNLTHLDDASLSPLPPDDWVLPGLLFHVQLVVAFLLPSVQVPALRCEPRARCGPSVRLAVVGPDEGVVVPSAARLSVGPW
mmetsp:Transcript_10628/g.30004  ORF Transcript_10628/g.30004 Transcript_10628/m.30004 type:complete len:315 (+) Transcript_10628:607-1551(+)